MEGGERKKTYTHTQRSRTEKPITQSKNCPNGKRLKEQNKINDRLFKPQIFPWMTHHCRMTTWFHKRFENLTYKHKMWKNVPPKIVCDQIIFFFNIYTCWWVLFNSPTFILSYFFLVHSFNNQNTLYRNNSLKITVNNNALRNCGKTIKKT